VLARAKQFEEELLVVQLAENGATAARLRAPRYHVEPNSRQGEVEVVAELQDSNDRLERAPAIKAREREDRPEVEEGRAAKLSPHLGEEEELYAALVLGTKDYLHKNGFAQAVLGLSGGVDSALVALIAVDALGKENVRCLVMPSHYSSKATQSDAEKMAANLGIRCDRVEIAPLIADYTVSLTPLFQDQEEDVTEENIQARIRGNLLMAVSNKFGSIVLTTGNKSEMSVGYFTIFGDAAGGFDCLADVPKLQVYSLTKWRNEQGRLSGLREWSQGAALEPGEKLVPEGIINRAPSAELRADQQDTDSLPPYEVLDPIIELYVEQNLSREEIEARGWARADVERVISLLDKSEYKRRMAPPGLKITQRAYGRDWRLPLTNGYLS
jgi:NAD+ synthase (glutamine-hydrolysing)